MPSLAPDIQSLLQLSAPLPSSITEELRVGHATLQRLDEEFKSASSDVRVWTFYETIDSPLSVADQHRVGTDGVYITVRLASVKSAVLGMRQESVFPLQADHANMASFGSQNAHTLRVFLEQLSEQIAQADSNLSRERGFVNNWEPNFEKRVQVEVHGFFEDCPSLEESHTLETPTIRVWSTKLPLDEFLEKGPDRCLGERLDEVDAVAGEAGSMDLRGRSLVIQQQFEDSAADSGFVPVTIKSVLGIKDNQLTFRRSTVSESPASQQSSNTAGQVFSITPSKEPQIPTRSPSREASSSRRLSSPAHRPSPLVRADLEQNLAIDRLSPPLRPRMCRSVDRHWPQLKYHSNSAYDDRRRSAFVQLDAEDADAYDAEYVPRLPETLLTFRRTARSEDGWTGETAVFDDLPATLSKPELGAQRFAWIHIPFNNPFWIKVREYFHCNPYSQSAPGVKLGTGRRLRRVVTPWVNLECTKN